MDLKLKSTWLELQALLIEKLPDTCDFELEAREEDKIPRLLVRRTEADAIRDALQVNEYSDDEISGLFHISDQVGIIAGVETLERVVEVTQLWLDREHSYLLEWKVVSPEDPE
jgi:hypothetical protein